MRAQVAASSAACIVLASLVAAPAPAVAAVAADQNYYWRWSDGSRLAARTFTQSQYGIASNLPALVVTAEPASPRRVVRLQFLTNGVWTTENVARTDGKGIARISLDPTCDAGAWCDATLRYRLVVAGQDARLAITYAN